MAETPPDQPPQSQSPGDQPQAPPPKPSQTPAYQPAPRPRPQRPPRATEPYGSIIERFRGTRWDARREPAPAPTSAASILVIAGVVALVAAGSVAVGLLVFQTPPATPRPSRVILTPPPTPGPGDLVEAAFWRYVASPTLSYHEAIEVVQTTGPNPVTEQLSLDVYLDDFSGTADVESEGLVKPTHFVLLRSGGVLYAKFRGDKQWRDAVIASQFSGLHARPFLSLEDPRQLVYDTPVELDGEVVHRLISTELYSPAITRLIPLGLGSQPTAEIKLVLLVTAEGMPIEARFTAHIPANITEGTKAVDLGTTYRFTNQGEVGPIPSPRL